MRGVLIMFTLAGGWPWGCGGDGTATDEARWATLRQEMVTTQIAARGVRDGTVLAALRTVPRHLFVPADVRAEAYADHPLPIGEGQTISQPYIVGLMTELLEVKAGDKVLEVGTGSGYQAAVLASMGCEVYTMEIRPALAHEAERRLASMGVKHVHVRASDGYAGWPEAAPFAGVIVTAAPEHIPQPLLDQLRIAGHMVIPVGSFYQQLKVITRRGAADFPERDVIPVRFVPMTGEVERRP
ncbi:MAG: protein-L-isoaspartate(D-aspartate) O-methyltransferase [Acidobacteriia bacterium]|nr:protein-L-isoaspartate(D-aspartate) O-methyltransferase [Terriglobia bacterium]